MELRNVLLTHPMQGFALLTALFVIILAIAILRSARGSYDRLLTALIGMIAIFHGLRIVSDLDMPRTSWYGESVNLVVALAYLGSLWVIGSLSLEHRNTKAALRVFESTQAVSFKFHPQPYNPDDYSKTVLDAAPMAMFAVGLDGNVSCWNRAAEKALGWSRDEVVGKKLPSLLFYPEARGGSGDSPLRLVHKTGAPLDSEVQSVPIRDAKGSVNGILTVFSPQTVNDHL
jgi:PAS domain S-box-containing protein